MPMGGGCCAVAGVTAISMAASMAPLSSRRTNARSRRSMTLSTKLSTQPARLAPLARRVTELYVRRRVASLNRSLWMVDEDDDLRRSHLADLDKGAPIGMAPHAAVYLISGA